MDKVEAFLINKVEISDYDLSKVDTICGFSVEVGYLIDKGEEDILEGGYGDWYDE